MGTRSSVLLVGNFLSRSAGNRGVCEDLAERLRSLGLSVLTTSAQPRRLERLLDMVKTAWLQRNAYTVAHVDVFSGPAFLWAEAVCWTLRRAGKPYVLTLHGGNLPAFAQRWSGRVRRLLRSAEIVTTPSRYLQVQMQEYRKDLHLLPNSLDLSVCRFQRRERVHPRLIWLRAFHEIYNPLLGARTLALLRRDWPTAHLTMIGPNKKDGSLERLRRLATELEIAEHITLAGFVPRAEVSRWLERGDIFLNTANVDNTPLSVLEAMAGGLCVVSTNVGGMPYLLEDEVDALLVPPDDPRSMAAAVQRLLTEPGLAERLSQNARRKAEQFDWALVLPRWEALLGSVAGARKT
jgi:glycosyltransferase involved in cell wall biosynthesis